MPVKEFEAKFHSIEFPTKTITIPEDKTCIKLRVIYKPPKKKKRPMKRFMQMLVPQQRLVMLKELEVRVE